MNFSFLKKTALVLLLFVFCVPVSLFAEDSSASSGNQQAQTFSVTTDPSEISLSTEDVRQTDVNDSPSTVFLFIKMILILAVVIGIIYALVFLMKKGMKSSSENDPFLRNVTRLTLSPGKSVQVVTLIDHAYLIGVTDSSINLLAEINDKELIDSMNLYFDKNTNTKRPRSFSDVLEIFMRTSSSGKKSVFSDSAADAVDAIKRQRKILNEDGGIE